MINAAVHRAKVQEAAGAKSFPAAGCGCSGKICSVDCPDPGTGAFGRHGNRSVTMDKDATAGNLSILIEACARSDTSALRLIMDAEGPRMLGVARRILNRGDLAEDAVQDTFVQIWRKASQFGTAQGTIGDTPDTSARSWIYAILRNRCLTLLRSAAREVATEDDRLEKQLDADTIDQAWTSLGHESDLRHCLGALQEEKRTAVLMAYVLGYSHGEIAGRLNAPLGSAKAWLRRGLAALRECMS